MQWINAGVSCNDVADHLGDGNACSPLPQGGFALTYKRDPEWYGLARKHHVDNSWDANDDTQLPRSRGLRFNLKSFGDGMLDFVSTSYNFFTGHIETVVKPGSQTARNVCLLARYGDAYDDANSFPTLPTIRSHALLARKRTECQHFFGVDDDPSSYSDTYGEAAAKTCASTETTAIKVYNLINLNFQINPLHILSLHFVQVRSLLFTCAPFVPLQVNQAFDDTFSDGNSCKACELGAKMRGKAKCWKRVYCYMDQDASSPSLEVCSRLFVRVDDVTSVSCVPHFQHAFQKNIRCFKIVLCIRSEFGSDFSLNIISSLFFCIPATRVIYLVFKSMNRKPSTVPSFCSFLIKPLAPSYS